jgi:tetratricopeptide (TPR) repeat protein
MKENKVLKLIILIFILAFVLLITKNLYIKSQENKALQAFNSEDYQKSIMHYESVLRFSNETQYYVNIAHNYYRLKDYQSALEIFESISIDEDDSESNYLLSLIYKELEMYDKSNMVLDSILSNDQEFSRAWQTKAEVDFERENYQEAVESYKRAIALRPNAGEFYLALANTYFQLGDINNEIETYEEMIIRGATAFNMTKDESMFIAEYNLAVSLFDEGRIEEAREIFMSATNKDIATADAWYYLASCAAILQQEGQMYHSLRQALLIDYTYLDIVKRDSDFSRYMNTNRFRDFISEYE